jgi:hypothetical protein
VFYWRASLNVAVLPFDFDKFGRAIGELEAVDDGVAKAPRRTCSTRPSENSLNQIAVSNVVNLFFFAPNGERWKMFQQLLRANQTGLQNREH